MLVDAIVGWIIESVADHGVQAGKRVLRGSKEEQALRRAVAAAIHAVAEHAPSGSRESSPRAC